MATRSYIGIYNSDSNTVDYIYCHFDGYLDYVGRILVDYYTDPERARQLIALGSISSIGADPTVQPVVSNNGYPDVNVSKNAQGVPVEVVAYHRERGEQLKRYTCTLPEYAEEDGMVSYVYLFKDGVWQVYARRAFVPVETLLRGDGE
jgi:hypothetical protein